MYFKVIQPGYAIAKRRSGISVTLNMDELYAGASKVNIRTIVVMIQITIHLQPALKFVG